MKLPLPAVLLMFTAAPALAQDGAPPAGGSERINQVIVYGDDPCPAAQGDEIVVCARMGEDERYRIPQVLRGDPNNPARESWTARVTALERVGRTGTQSCSPAGLGGFTGCQAQLINDAYAERGQAGNVNWTNAVSEERRRRMEGFTEEAEAAEQQALMDERARVAREAAAADAADPEAAPLPDPTGMTRTPPGLSQPAAPAPAPTPQPGTPPQR